MTQRVPFSASGRTGMFNTSLLNTGGVVVEDFEIRNILSAYNQKNGESHCYGERGKRLVSFPVKHTDVHLLTNTPVAPKPSIPP